MPAPQQPLKLQAQDGGLDFYINGQVAKKVHLNANAASDLIAEYEKLPKPPVD